MYKNSIMFRIRQIGGERVIECDKGCIFMPSLVDHNENVVSKIIYHDKPEIPNEVAANQKMLEIDPDGKYHCKMINHFPISQILESASDYLKKCFVFKSASYKEEFYVINFDYCNGKTLKDFLIENIENPAEMKKMWKGFANIIDGLELMASNNIFHNDVHSENIFVIKDNSSYTLKLIDFGNSRTNLDKENDFRQLKNNVGLQLEFLDDDLSEKFYDTPIKDIPNLGGTRN